MLAAFEAALVESDMENLNYGDEDSLGVFQQRPSQGWGTPDQVTNVNYAAHQFFTRAINIDRTDPKLTPGLLAQAVQRSAFANRYDRAEADARRLLTDTEHALGGPPAPQPPPPPPPPPQGPPPPEVIAEWARVSESHFDYCLHYTYGEMMRNSNSPIAWAIWGLYHNPMPVPELEVRQLAREILPVAEWNKYLEVIDDGLSRPAPLVMFGVMVRPGGPWDHKPKIEAALHIDPKNTAAHYFKIPNDHPKQREMFYDNWSNMHYGFVGRAAGIDTNTLMQAQNVPIVAGNGQDPGDDINVRAGIELWDTFGRDLRIEQFHAKVMEAADKIYSARAQGGWDKQVRDWFPHQP